METKNEIYFWKNFRRRLWNDFLRLKVLLNVNQLQTFGRHLQKKENEIILTFELFQIQNLSSMIFLL